MKNYADRGGCYPPRPSFSVNIRRDLHNFSIHTKAEFITVLLFIQNISRLCTDNIHRAISFAYFCISSIQFKPEIQLFCLRIT